MLSHNTPSNRLLQLLPAADFDLLKPFLRSAQVDRGTVLVEQGDLLRKVYFPENVVVSLVLTLSSGLEVETAMVGRDGVLGSLSVLDGKVSPCRAVAQVGGSALQLELSNLRTIVEKSAAVRRMFTLNDQALIAETQLTAACNVGHHLDVRLARWLLRARDLSGVDEMAITQDFMANMLGVRRPSVSTTASELQERGLIKYRRGNVQIADVDGLRKLACDCYQHAKSYQDHLFDRE